MKKGSHNQATRIRIYCMYVIYVYCTIIAETFNTFDLHLLGPIALWRLKQSASVDACTVQQNMTNRIKYSLVKQERRHCLIDTLKHTQ